MIKNYIRKRVKLKFHLCRKVKKVLSKKLIKLNIKIKYQNWRFNFKMLIFNINLIKDN